MNLHDLEVARRFPRIVALREGRVAYDGPPERLSDEALQRIYAGDAGRSREREEPERRWRDPISVTEGRDGVSSH